MNPTLQPLLSTAEVNRLIQQAGRFNASSNHAGRRIASFGEQASRAYGSGMDFADRRPYQSGDDPRFIDWRASARSVQTLIRRFHSEVSYPGCMVIDRRVSMAFATRSRLKATQALRAGITLGTQMLQTGNPLGWLVLDQTEYWQAPQPGLAGLQRAAMLAARPCPPVDSPQHDLHWNRIGHGLISRLPQGSQLALVSDFATLDASALKTLRLLGNYFDCRAVHILDASELKFPDATTIRLQWGTLQFTPCTDRHAIQTALQQRRQQIEDWFRQARCGYIQLSCDDSLDRLRA